MKFLLNRAPELVLGGQEISTGQQSLKKFWDTYESFHPTHAVYQLQQPERTRGNTLVLQLHGDEGRGLKKGNTCVIMVETVLGLDSFQSSSKRQSRACEDCCLSEKSAKRCRLASGFRECSTSVSSDDCPTHMQTNYKLHSYLTRFVLVVLPNRLSKDKNLLNLIFIRLTEDFKELFEKGVATQSGRWFGALLGFKGDLKWYEKIASLDRCFNRQLKSEAHMCHECLAGVPTLPFETISHHPAWEETIYSQRPWSFPPPWESIPFNVDNQNPKPEMILRRDVFHNFKLGVLRDFTASAILLLCHLKYFHETKTRGSGISNKIDVLLERAYHHFRLYCDTSKRYPALHSFTPIFFNRTKSTDYPWMNAKGSDIVLVVAWLRVFVAGLLLNPLAEDHKHVLAAIQEGAAAVENFHGILYTHGIFLHKECGARLHQELHTALNCYNKLAFHSLYGYSFCGFSMKSKFHGMCHTKRDLLVDLESATSAYVISPLCFACEGNEDTIGRISRLSRRVSPRIPSKRTLELYLVKAKMVYDRYRKQRKINGQGTPKK